MKKKEKTKKKDKKTKKKIKKQKKRKKSIILFFLSKGYGILLNIQIFRLYLRFIYVLRH